MPRAKAQRLGRNVKPFEAAGSSDFFVELGDFVYAKLILKCVDSLLQCPLTTIQAPDSWLRSTASTVNPVSNFHSGGVSSGSVELRKKKLDVQKLCLNA